MEIKLEPTSQHVTWTIKDFLRLPQKNDSYLDSPEFMFSGDIYCLRLYPKVNRSNGKRTEFHVRRLSVNFPEREVSCEVGNRWIESNGDDWYWYKSKTLEEDFSYPRSLLEGDRDMYVPDGIFTIVCFMWLSKDSRAGSSTPEEEDQGGFPGLNASFPPRGSLQKMELLTESPCTSIHLTVPFFKLRSKTCDSLTSPEFHFSGDTYYFRFESNGDTGDTDLQLVRLASSIPERTVFYRVGYCWGEWHKYPKNSRSLVGDVGLCITRSKLEEERDKYVTDGTLRLEIFLRVEEQSNAGAGTSDAVHKRTGISGFRRILNYFRDIRKLQSDYRQLLQKGTESDACVVVCGKEFKVHKSILRTRSPVFEAMFGHDMAEKESGRVVVDDLDPECFGDFLEYLYTGDVQNQISDDNAFGLYAAADKYDVSYLKSECVEHMRCTLSVDSFCDVVTLALRHREEGLSQQAIKFFKDNLQQIIITAKWQQFNIDNGATANELLIKALVPGKQ